MLQEKTIPYLHPNVSISHLYENSKLFTDEEIKFIFNFFEKNPELYRVKIATQNGNFYNVLKLSLKNQNFALYAIYLGAKHQKHLGNGYYGKVKLMQNLETGEWQALKIQKKLSMTEKFSLLQNETMALEKQEKYLGSRSRDLYNNFPETEKTKKNSENHYQLFNAQNNSFNFQNLSFSLPIVNRHELLGLKLHKGITLAKFAKRKLDLPCNHWIQILINVCETVHHFHTVYKLIHNDIKPDNIIIDPVTYQIELLDFQFTSKPFATRNNACGSPGYMSLELLCGYNKIEFNPATDIHALGITLAELLGNIVESYTVGNVTFNEPQRFRVIPFNYFQTNNNKSSCPTIQQYIPDVNIRKKIINLLLLMSSDNPKNRPSLEIIIKHLKKLQALAKTRPKNLGILNIHDYYTSSEPERNEFRDQLKRMDEVIFIDLIERDTIEYLYLFNEFKSLKVKINERIFYPSSLNETPEELFKELKIKLSNDSSGLAYQQNCIYIASSKISSQEFSVNENKREITFKA